MSQNKHSEAQRRRTFKRVRGVILILLVVGLIVWGVTALIRRGAGKPDPTPDPNAGQQTEQPGGLPEPDPALGECLMCNYAGAGEPQVLRPWEARVVRSEVQIS